MKCDNCKNKDICKHVDYMQSVENKVKDLGLNKDVSIRVEIKCGYMQEKNCSNKIFKFDELIPVDDLPSRIKNKHPYWFGNY